MYISGTIYDFEQRLHSLPTGSGDLDQFYAEMTGYGDITQLSPKWEKEIKKKEWIHFWSSTGVL